MRRGGGIGSSTTFEEIRKHLTLISTELQKKVTEKRSKVRLLEETINKSLERMEQQKFSLNLANKITVGPVR